MWQNNSALPFSVAAPRIMSRMARGDVRRAIQTAVGGEGRRAWPIIIPQMILATLFLGVMRELLLPGNPEPMGSASADSFLRCFLLLAEALPLLLILMKLMAIITGTGATAGDLLSLMAAAAFPLTVCLALSATAAVVFPAVSLPLAALGCALALIVLYMGMEFAAIMVKRRSFVCFAAMMAVYLPAVWVLAGQILGIRG